MSKITPNFRGKIVKGRFYAFDQDMYNFYIESLNDQIVELSLKKYKKQRSDPQNKYYWGVVVKLISEHTGYREDEVHALLGSLFLKDYKVMGNKRYTVVKSSTSLKTDEFSEFVENCKRWAATELGVFVPEPSQISN